MNMAHNYVGYCVLQVNGYRYIFIRQFFISRETSKETAQKDIIQIKLLLVEYNKLKRTEILCLE